MFDLSNRTGASAKALHGLQEAFKVTGIDAGAVDGMILRLQRSLSGVNEQGEKTDKLFKALGLDQEGLKRGDAAGQFMAVAQALRGLSKEDAIGAAAKLFGREGAGNMVQISRDLQGFREAFAESARESAVFGRTAAVFDRLGDMVPRIRGEIEGMWAGMAEGAAPAIEAVLGALKGIDWVGIGERIGRIATAVTQAFREGKLEEYFTLSLQAGVQGASNLMMGEIQKWGVEIGKVLGGGGGGGEPGFWGKLGAGTLGVGAGLLGLWNEFGSMLGVPGANEMADKRIDQAQGLFNKAGIGDGVLNRVAEAMVSGTKGLPNVYAENLAKLNAELVARAGQAAGSVLAGSGGGDGLLGDLFAKTRIGKQEAGSAWEKLGFVLGGGGGLGDYTKVTADNTRLMLAEQKRTNGLLGGLGNGASYGNV